MIDAFHSLFAKRRAEPSYPVLPMVDEDGQTNVPGVFAVGELAGTPLVRLGLNAGHDLVERIGPELARTQGPDPELLDVVIVGSGSSGLAATVTAADLGLRYVTLEAAALANTFVTMTKGKLLLAEPGGVPLRSRVWFEECTREELLAKWRALVAEEGLEIHEHEKVTRVGGSEGAFEVETALATYRTRRVVLALGKAGNPRRLGVPGEREHGDRVHHRLLDPDDFRDRDVVIVGAGDVACEAAIALARDGSNRVTLSAIDEAFTYPKQRNVDAVRALEEQGRLRILLSSEVTRFEDEVVEVRTADGVQSVPYDVVFEMIGAELPVGFLRSVGVRLDTDWPPGRWLGLGAAFVGAYSLYALKSFGKGSSTAFPFEHLVTPEAYDAVIGPLFGAAFAPFSWLFSAEALSQIQADRGFQQGYLYSLVYTLVMLVFGYQAMIRWRRRARDPSYQTWRFASLVGFQVAFFLVVNVVGVQALTVKYAWRSWGLYQPFPLFFNTFFWWYPEDPGWIKWSFIVAGVLGTFVAIPLAARNHGKRFCTWVCGCGGLAETLGDRWRHLAPKGQRSRAWEFQGAVVLAAATLVGVVVVGAYQSSGSNNWWYAYNYLVDFWLVAVIPIALYPFFGGKIWCRYWCPLAAYNGLLARWYGRLKIVSDDHCITCTECSRYCQVGVDVMAFAKDQRAFDNSNSACIQCGICIDVCPMSVLSFETSDGSAEMRSG
ncbi:MAG TPA: NAD(P)-binding domain-containing protein [Myxococcota bacterium]|nr:NAD(P)-binding domain-containing protein [Myxococcota bacterium]